MEVIVRRSSGVIPVASNGEISNGRARACWLPPAVSAPETYGSAKDPELNPGDVPDEEASVNEHLTKSTVQR